MLIPLIFRQKILAKLSKIVYIKAAPTCHWRKHFFFFFLVICIYVPALFHAMQLLKLGAVFFVKWYFLMHFFDYRSRSNIIHFEKKSNISFLIFRLLNNETIKKCLLLTSLRLLACHSSDQIVPNCFSSANEKENKNWNGFHDKEEKVQVSSQLVPWRAFGSYLQVQFSHYFSAL